MLRLDPFVRMVANEARKRRLDYLQFNKRIAAVREHLGLSRPRHPSRRLQHILPMDALERLYQSIDSAQDVSIA